MFPQSLLFKSNSDEMFSVDAILLMQLSLEESCPLLMYIFTSSATREIILDFLVTMGDNIRTLSALQNVLLFLSISYKNSQLVEAILDG